MGCCFSKEIEKARLIGDHPASPTKNDGALGTYSPPTTPVKESATSIKQIVGGPASQNNSTSNTIVAASPRPPPTVPSIDNIEKDIRSKWEKSMHALPVASDFPRLAKLTKIFGEEGELEIPTQPSVERIIYSILLTLAVQLNDSQSHDNTRDNYWTYLRENIEGEIRREFDSFLKNCLAEDSKVAHVLKTINQGVIAPAVISLKLALPTLPFKDFRNSWRIEVIVSLDTVTVVHIRREQSFNTPPEMTFEFVWECRIVFNKEVTRMDEVKVRIIELAFGEKVSPDNNNKIRNEMKRFLTEDCVYSTLSA